MFWLSYRYRPLILVDKILRTGLTGLYSFVLEFRKVKPCTLQMTKFRIYRNCSFVCSRVPYVLHNWPLNCDVSRETKTIINFSHGYRSQTNPLHSIKVTYFDLKINFNQTDIPRDIHTILQHSAASNINESIKKHQTCTQYLKLVVLANIFFSNVKIA